MGSFARFLDPSAPDENQDGQAHFYCAACGLITRPPFLFCPRCGAQRRPADPLSVHTLVQVLEDLHTVHARGLIDRAAFLRLRRHYESRFQEQHAQQTVPARHGNSPAEVPVAPGAPLAVAQPAGRTLPPLPPRFTAPLPAPPPPRRPIGDVLAQWATARQSDILLYLGAFLLSIAALIFVSYQGDALSGPVRFAILVAYTLSFTGLGLVLPRWERVREAGAVFLGLGAALVPIDFIALRTQALGNTNMSNDVLLLAGSVATAALYLGLASHGHGRLYALPGAAAIVFGWGALGSVVGVGLEWQGAWYVAGMAVLHTMLLYRCERLPGRSWVRRTAVVIGALGLVYAHLVALVGIAEAPLPLAHLAVLAGVVIVLRHGRSVRAFGLLPLSITLTALATSWALWGISSEWFVPFIALAGLVYLAVAHVDDDEREAQWIAAAVMCGLIALGTGHMAIAAPVVNEAMLPVTYVLVLLGAAVAAWRWRRRDLLAGIPALALGFGAGVMWAAGRLPLEWLGVWAAGAGLAYLAIAERDAPFQTRWRITAGCAALAAVTWAHLAPAAGRTDALHLPITYGLVLAGALWDGRRGRDAGLAALPFLGALFTGSVLWAAGVSPVWWVHPAIAAAAVVSLAEPWWRDRPGIGNAGWPVFLIAAASIPVLGLRLFEQDPAHGVAAMLALAALLVMAGARSHGLPIAARVAKRNMPEPVVERRTLHQAAAFYALGAVGFANTLAGLSGADRAWLIAGAGAGAWVAVAALGGTYRSLLAILSLPAMAALAVACALAGFDAGILTAVALIGLAAPLTAFPATRRPLLLVCALPFGMLTIAAFWVLHDYPLAHIGIAYAAVAALLWGGLTWVRTYDSGERGAAVAALSWVPWSVALAAAFVAVCADMLDPGNHPLSGTRSWAIQALVVAAAATALLVEGARLRRPVVWVGGTAGLLLALLLLIARTQPENVQAYTFPVGLYLVAIGLIFRRSQPLAGPNLNAHEAVIVLGLLFLTLPAAEQGFAPDGGPYGIELMAMGVLFLALGFALTVRWLVAGGVLTLSGVALRWLTAFSAQVPYWITLGVVGTLLLAAGLLLLLQRNRWERWSRTVAAWWAAPSGSAADSGTA